MSLHSDNVYSSNIPETKPLSFTASANKVTPVALQFQAKAIPTLNINLNIQGLPQSANTVTVGLTSANKTYTFNNLNNGSHPVTVQAGTYTISSNNYIDQAKTYTATLSNPYALSDGASVSITYSEVKTALLMPFKDVTFNMLWSSDPATSNLQEIADNSKNYSYVLAFITQNQWSPGQCYPAWGGTPSLALKDKFYQKEVQYLQSKNGVIAVSFGGENGMCRQG